MSRQAAQSESTNHPEFVVSREGFNRFFDKPMPTSTFHDLVNKGKITPFKHIRGMYRLNDSLRRLGLKQVMELPKPEPRVRIDDVVRMAFCMIDPDLFPPPSWLLAVEVFDERDLDHAYLWADMHRDAVAALDDPSLKMHYFQGVLDAAVLMETEGKE